MQGSFKKYVTSKKTFFDATPPDLVFAASRTLLQRLLACLNFTLDLENWFCWYKQKSDFYELWQQQKQLKSIEVSEV